MANHHQRKDPFTQGHPLLSDTGQSLGCLASDCTTPTHGGEAPCRGSALHVATTATYHVVGVATSVLSGGPEAASRS